MGDFFNAIITKPLAWVFLQLYHLVSNYGLAIILFTILSKLVLLPLSMKGRRGMIDSTRIQPKVKELEARYKDDKNKYQVEVTKLYQKENVSLTGGCLWMLLPFPILLALYAIIRTPLTNMLGLGMDQVQALANSLSVVFNAKDYYAEIALAQTVHENLQVARSVIPNILDIDFNFLGFNLGTIPSWKDFSNINFLFPLISAGFSYLSAWLSQKFMYSGKQVAEQTSMQKNMLLMGPLFSLIFGFTVPMALSLYWIFSSMLTIVQDYFVSNYYNKMYAEKDRKEAEKNARLEANRLAELELNKERDRQRQISDSEKKKPGTKYRVSGKPKKKK